MRERGRKVLQDKTPSRNSPYPLTPSKSLATGKSGRQSIPALRLTRGAENATSEYEQDSEGEPSALPHAVTHHVPSQQFIDELLASPSPIKGAKLSGPLQTTPIPVKHKSLNQVPSLPPTPSPLRLPKTHKPQSRPQLPQVQTRSHSSNIMKGTAVLGSPLPPSDPPSTSDFNYPVPSERKEKRREELEPADEEQEQELAYQAPVDEVLDDGYNDDEAEAVVDENDPVAPTYYKKVITRQTSQTEEVEVYRDASRSSDDPFGLLAVEKRLKEERNERRRAEKGKARAVTGPAMIEPQKRVERAPLGVLAYASSDPPPSPAPVHVADVYRGDSPPRMAEQYQEDSDDDMYADEVDENVPPTRAQEEVVEEEEEEEEVAEERPYQRTLIEAQYKLSDNEGTTVANKENAPPTRPRPSVPAAAQKQAGPSNAQTAPSDRPVFPFENEEIPTPPPSPHPHHVDPKRYPLNSPFSSPSTPCDRDLPIDDSDVSSPSPVKPMTVPTPLIRTSATPRSSAFRGRGGGMVGSSVARGSTLGKRKLPDQASSPTARKKPRLSNNAPPVSRNVHALPADNQSDADDDGFDHTSRDLSPMTINRNLEKLLPKRTAKGAAGVKPPASTQVKDKGKGKANQEPSSSPRATRQTRSSTAASKAKTTTTTKPAAVAVEDVESDGSEGDMEDNDTDSDDAYAAKKRKASTSKAQPKATKKAKTEESSSTKPPSSARRGGGRGATAKPPSSRGRGRPRKPTSSSSARGGGRKPASTSRTRGKSHAKAEEIEEEDSVCMDTFFLSYVAFEVDA
ncbi:hypothetical protein K474DRAFT_1666417 [Panus rudis PR-1116 ss-1]|nr:hypothetical protein K474DRAFT_1666417 [Panus rudis PR-1116 ss-1]